MSADVQDFHQRLTRQVEESKAVLAALAGVTDVGSDQQQRTRLEALIIEWDTIQPGQVGLAVDIARLVNEAKRLKGRFS